MKSKILNFLDAIFESKIIIVIISVLVIIFAGVYYFGILNIVVPTGEDCIPTYHRYLDEITGRRIQCAYNKICPEKEILLKLTGTIAYKILGLSFDTVRLLKTMQYCLVVLSSLLLIFIVKKKNENMVYFLPIFILFIVELPPFSTNSNFGFLDTPNQDIIHYYPANYHSDIIAVSLICTLLTAIFVKCKKNINKIILLIIIICISAYYIFHYGDIIFLALYIIPIVGIISINLLKDSKYSKFIIIGIITVLFILTITKIMPVQSVIHEKLWSSAHDDIYATGVYGATNWRNVDDLFGALNETFRMIFQLFGMDRTNMTIVSAWTLIIIIKAMFLLMVAIIIISVIVTTLNGTALHKGYDVVDQVCAFGVMILLFAKVFTEFNYHYSYDRFFVGIVVYSTIIFIRNIVSMSNRIFAVNIFDSVQKRISILMIGGLIALLSLNNVWGYEKIDHYGEDMMKCIEYIKENGEGYAIAKFTLGPRMSIQSNGEVLFFESQEEQNSYFGGNEKPRYVISNTNKNVYHAIYDERIRAFVGENETPKETVKFGDIWLHVLY